jgi:hypothetical protein
MRRLAYTVFVILLGLPMIGLVVYMVSEQDSRLMRFLWVGVLVAYSLGLRFLWRALFGPIPRETRFEMSLYELEWHPIRTLRRLKRRRA